jgi:hypothetical protein
MKNLIVDAGRLPGAITQQPLRSSGRDIDFDNGGPKLGAKRDRQQQQRQQEPHITCP